MVTITYDLPPSAFAALHLSPKEFAREMRTAACVQWYAQGLVSQERAADIAGLSRAEFLEELFQRRVPVCQMPLEELIEEMEDENLEAEGVPEICYSAGAIQYAQLRLERLIKLSRTSVRVRLTGDLSVADVAHRWIVRYARLLIQILLGRTGIAEEERHLLSALLREVPLRDPELRRRALALVASRSGDYRTVKAGGALLQKAGASSMSPEKLGRYMNWIKTSVPRPESVIVILSRGLPDAILAGELLEVPVRAVCFSRQRLGLDSVLAVDLPSSMPSGSSLLVDAHCESGETLARCWSFIESRGIRVLGAIIGQDAGSEEAILPSWMRTRSQEGWSLITPTG